MKKRLVQYRKGMRIIPKRDQYNYIRRSFRKLRPVLIEIQYRKEGDIVREALIEHSIRKTVTIFEITFKSISYHLGSDIGSDLDVVLKGDFSKDSGTALASSFSFANPKTVMSLYDELLGINFLDELKKYYDEFNNEGVEHEECHIRNIPLLSKNLENFEKIFVYRNLLVHHDNLPVIPYKDLRKMIGSVFDVMVVSWIIDWEKKFDL